SLGDRLQLSVELDTLPVKPPSWSKRKIFLPEHLLRGIMYHAGGAWTCRSRHRNRREREEAGRRSVPSPG
ncbi:hypothetical protein, partial [Thermogutta sp.]|uniref:hypothetical protein n=1 Tax=Thermogutta sp. TaxID=1962930 RepID=UPI0032207C69